MPSLTLVLQVLGKETEGNEKPRMIFNNFDSINSFLEYNTNQIKVKSKLVRISSF